MAKNCIECVKDPCSKCNLDRTPGYDEDSIEVKLRGRAKPIVADERRLFNRECPCSCIRDSLLWQCYICVITDRRGGLRVSLRTAGYYKSHEERERLYDAANVAELGIDELLRSTIATVSENCFLLGDIRNDILKIRKPGMFHDRPETADANLWRFTNAVFVTRDGRVHVKHVIKHHFADTYVRHNNTRWAIAAIMSDVAKMIDEYNEGILPSFTMRDANACSKKLQSDIRERLFTLGDAFVTKWQEANNVVMMKK